MIIGEPTRALKNPAFQLKMVVLVAALIVTGLFQFLQRRNAAFAELRPGPPACRADSRKRSCAVGAN